MPTELFASVPPVKVTSGGGTCPPAGTVETWTVSGNTPSYPAASSSAGTLFHVQDTTPGFGDEYIAVTNVTGNTWTVVRGADGTSPAFHGGLFNVRQVIPSGFLSASQAAITTAALSLRTTAV